jgi:lysophospholipase L1-like esterase
MLQSLVPQVPTNTELVIIDCGTNDAFVPTIDGPYNSLLDALLAQAPQAVILPGWIQYTSYRFGGTGFQNAESLVNDSIYRVTMNSAKGPRVIWPPVDYQQIPEWYLSEDGIHPSPAGYDVKAILIYNRIRAKFGLPDVAQPLCGMVGDWRIPHVAYSPCSVTRAK